MLISAPIPQNFKQFNRFQPNSINPKNNMITIVGNIYSPQGGIIFKALNLRNETIHERHFKQ